MKPHEDAEYKRRLEAREARRQQIDEATGTRTVGAAASVEPARKRKTRSRKRRRHNSGGDDWSSRDVYGNTVIGPWRRNNSGGWSRS